MKRVFFLVCGLILFAASTNAQFFSYGIKGGISSSKISIDQTSFDNITTTDGVRNLIVEQGNAKLGFHLGVFTRIKVAFIYIQPELLFNQSNGQFVITEQDPDNLSSVIQNVTSQKFNKFDVPVMVGLKFKAFRFNAGPVATIMLNESDGLRDKIAQLTGSSVSSNLKNAVFGYQVGVGLDFKRFATLDLKYEGNLSKLGETMSIGSSNFQFDQRSPQLIASLGIFF
jgi:hypothetical protein